MARKTKAGEEDPTNRYYLKCLDPGRKPRNGGGRRWPRIGRWTPRRDSPHLDREGWHVFRPRSLLRWLGGELYVAQIRGKVVVGSDRVCAQQARLIYKLPWDQTVARLWATDCVERARQGIGNGDTLASQELEWAADRLSDNPIAAASAAAHIFQDWRGEQRWQTRRLLAHYCGVKLLGRPPR